MTWDPKRLIPRRLRSRSAQPRPAASSASSAHAAPAISQTPSTTTSFAAGSSPTPSSSVAANTTSSLTANSSQPYGSLPLNPPRTGLWKVGHQRLSEEDRITLENALSASAAAEPNPDILLGAAKDKRKTCEDKRWTFEFRGHTVQLRDTVDKVVTWLDKFKTVVDVAVNADPVHAGLPWAGIKFLLLMTVSEKQQMAGLALGLDRVLYIIARCRVYESLYPPGGNLARAGENFDEALTSLYVLILEFLAEAIRIYSRGTSTRTRKAFLMSDDIIDFEKRCQDLEDRVETEAHNCQRFYNKLLEELRELKDPIERIDNGVAAIWKTLDGVQRADILSWVSNTPYLDHHTTARNGRTEGTGGWLLEHNVYQLWQSSDESMILWLHGIPRTGKTKLVSRYIDEFANRQDDHALAYFYCNRNETSRRDPENVLRSFVKQLSISRDEGAIQDALVEVYQQKRRTGFASEKLGLDECEGILDRLIRGYSRTTLILDALDECESATRESLFKVFNNLINRSQHLKILVSSRRDGDIKLQLDKEANVGISATDNEDDISKFVSERVDQSQGARRVPISEDLREDIVQTLLEKSKGMFQWAALQIAQLLELGLEFDIRDRLGQLPDGLTEAYDEIYAKIKSKKGSKPAIAIRAFQWVMCARAPLRAEVLLAAIWQDPEDDKTQTPPKEMDIDFVLDTCHNLLVVDHESVCRLSHLSVREYFEIQHWNFSCANGAVAKVCLSLLNDPSNWDRDKNTDEADQSSPLTELLDYIRTYWPAHVREHGDTDIDNRLSMLLQRFLGSVDESALAYRSWHKKSYSSRTMFWRDPMANFYHELKPSTSTVLAMCLFGFNSVLSSWWDSMEIDFNQQNEQGDSLLVLAVFGGSLNTVKRLLERANVNKQCGGHFGSALAAAAIQKNKDIVQLLLDSGANVNMQLSCGEYGSALAAAALWEKKDTVQLLLDSGANVNMQLSCSKYGSALAAAAAAAWGNEDTVQLLLDSGADVNMQLSCGKYGSALGAAQSVSVNKDVMQLLQEYGARDLSSNPASA